MTRDQQRDEFLKQVIETPDDDDPDDAEALALRLVKTEWPWVDFAYSYRT